MKSLRLRWKGRRLRVAALAMVPLAGCWAVAKRASWRVALPAAGFIVREVAFSPDGKYLAVASHRGQVLGSFSDSWALSPDASLIAVGDDDKHIRLWNITDGKILRTLKTNVAANTLAFSPGGATLASAGIDGRFQLWRIK